MERHDLAVKGYKELIVWQKAMKLVSRVYQVTRAFPAQEKFGLTSQMQRAAVSIAANIAEGQARKSRKQFVQFLRISNGSLAELETEIMIAADFGY